MHTTLKEFKWPTTPQEDIALTFWKDHLTHQRIQKLQKKSQKHDHN